MRSVRWIVAAAVMVSGVGCSGDKGASPAAPAATTQPAATAHTGGVGAAVPAETPAKDLSAKEQAARMAKWRAEIRKTLYVPDKLPALEAKKWSTLLADGGGDGGPGDVSDDGRDAGAGDCLSA